MIIRRIEPMSAAKLAGTVYAVLGFIVGLCFTLLSFVGGMGSSLGAMGALFGVGAIILLPIFYGVIGFIVALIGTSVYNWAAQRVGGLEIQTD
jgi:hypothetical protein